MDSTTEPRLLETIEVRVQLYDEDLRDIWITAFEGGMRYWCPRVEDVDALDPLPHEAPSEWLVRGLLAGSTLRLLEDVGEGDTPQWHSLTTKRFVLGVRRWITHRSAQGRTPRIEDSRLDVGNIDATEAEVILQFALFDEIRYG